MTDAKFYLNTLTGKVSLLEPDAASVFPNYLLEVEEGTKDLAPELFKPGTVEEFQARRNKGSKYAPAEKIGEIVTPTENTTSEENG